MTGGKYLKQLTVPSLCSFRIDGWTSNLYCMLPYVTSLTCLVISNISHLSRYFKHLSPASLLQTSLTCLVISNISHLPRYFKHLSPASLFQISIHSIFCQAARKLAIAAVTLDSFETRLEASEAWVIFSSSACSMSYIDCPILYVSYDIRCLGRSFHGTGALHRCNYKMFIWNHL